MLEMDNSTDGSSGRCDEGVEREGSVRKARQRLEGGRRHNAMGWVVARRDGDKWLVVGQMGINGVGEEIRQHTW